MLKIKKIMAILAAMAVITTAGVSMAASVSADNVDEYSTVYKQVLADYQNDPQFTLMSSASPEDAANYLIRETEKRLDILNSRQGNSLITPLATTSTTAYVSFSNVKQSETWYCGYASALMAIDGMGKKSSVNGSTDANKQNTLRAKRPQDSGSAVVWEVAADLNDYITNTKTYSYYLGTGMSATTFSSKVYTSLANDRAPILHAMTGTLSYYNGVNLGHYITISNIDQQNSTVTLRDPHYDNAYYGSHTVTTANALSSISMSSNTRYLICY